MGTTSSTKFIKNNGGTLTEVYTLTTSAGSGDANAIPALNASGILDSTIVNSTTTSAGAGSSGKLAALNGSGVLDSTIINSKTTSAGAGDSGKIPALNSSGQLDSTFMPTGIGADTMILTASEALSAGAFVNIWNNSSVFSVRNADNTATGKEAHGFVLSAVSSSGSATIYFAGTNTAVTGQTAGVVYLGVAGTSTSTPPIGTGKVVQRIGLAGSASSVNFQALDPIVLA